MSEREFVWIEDRNVETGHGWRDQTYRISVSQINPLDGDLVSEILVDPEEDAWCSTNSPDCSYAWICPKDYWDSSNHRHVKDNLRAADIKKFYPEFRGCADMESHFEFRMSPKEMRQYFDFLGFTEVSFNE